MRDIRHIRQVGDVLLLASAFVVSVLSVSNLLPLLLDITIRSMTMWDATLLAGDLFAVTLALAVLARAMYRLDRKAGRIRNRIRWFE
jgi:hypothetical protein